MDWRSQLSSYSTRALNFLKQNRFLIPVIVVGVIVFAVVVRDLFVVFVRGYAWKPGTGFTGKTLCWTLSKLNLSNRITHGFEQAWE
jgi:hypothetical protein